MSKNILEVCLSPDLGGLELYMSSCAQQLDTNFNVISVLSTKTKLEQYFLDTKYTYLKIKRKSSFSLFSSLKLAKIIDKNLIDIVHIHWTKDIPIVVFAKIFSKRKPKIVQTRHMTMTRFKDDFYHKFLYKNIDVILAVTKEVSSQINKFIPNNIRPLVEVLYLGAKNSEVCSQDIIKEYRNSLDSNESFMVGLVGRINEFKGQYLLIDAMQKLVSKGLDIKAFIVGNAMSPEYLETLKAKIRDYKLEDNVKFLGFTNEAEKFMQACDVVLMTSKNETFGLVTIEAMQNGTCVIGANSGGVLEIIEDNHTGLLFDSGDYDSLASKIELVYQDEKLKNTLSTCGQQKVNEDFNYEKQFEKLSKILSEL